MAKPKILDSELLREISSRTGVPENVVLRVMRVFEEIVKQCVESKVEVSLAGLGVFSFRDSKPCRNKRALNMFTKEVYYYDKPGWFIPTFRACRPWKKQLKEKTLYGFTEEEIEEWNKMRQNYGEDENIEENENEEKESD